jgi:antitoxin component of RelBE/YafQ-DinJ toxin-antitoxin module
MSINTETLHYQVSPDLKKRIKRYAASRGLPMASALRVLLDQALTDAGFPRTK